MDDFASSRPPTLDELARKLDLPYAAAMASLPRQASTSAKPSKPLSKVAIFVSPRSAITARWVQSVKLSAA